MLFIHDPLLYLMLHKITVFAAQDYRDFFCMFLFHWLQQMSVFAAQDYGEFVCDVFDTFFRTKLS